MSAIYDKSLKRIKAIQKQIEQGKITEEDGNRKISRIKSKGEQYWIRYTDQFGKTHDERVPAGGIKAAKSFETKRKAEVLGREYSPIAKLRASVSQITKIYLEEKMAGRGGYRSARTYTDRADALIGGLKLERMDSNPSLLLRHFEDLPKDWSKKTIWNYRAVLKAAVQHYLDSRRLNIRNPLDVVKIEKGVRRRVDFPTFEQYQKMVKDAQEHCKDSVWRYIMAAYETGLRENEILAWTWEKVCLDYKPGPPETVELPYITFTPSKQKDAAPKEIPISSRLWEALKGMPGQKEHGPVWPWKNHPRKTIDKVLERCELTHLVFHDFRRAWKINHIGAPQKLTRDAVGHQTDEMDQYYTIVGRRELQGLYAEEYKGTFSGPN